MAKKRNSGNPAKAGWDPIQVGPAQRHTPMAKEFYESGGQRHHFQYRNPQPATACLAFESRLYNGIALVFQDGSMHLSFKRRDRAPVRDWRHFQAIKNSVAGRDREAIEIFPREDNLTDAANEYHLFVLPPDLESPLGFAGPPALMPEYDLMDHASYRQGGPPGSRQRAWEDGIPTGLGLEQDDGET